MQIVICKSNRVFARVISGLISAENCFKWNVRQSTVNFQSRSQQSGDSRWLSMTFPPVKMQVTATAVLLIRLSMILVRWRFMQYSCPATNIWSRLPREISSAVSGLLIGLCIYRLSDSGASLTPFECKMMFWYFKNLRGYVQRVERSQREVRTWYRKPKNGFFYRNS